MTMKLELNVIRSQFMVSLKKNMYHDPSKNLDREHNSENNFGIVVKGNRVE